MQGEHIPKICTTYFAKIGQLPDSIVPLSICGRVPDWYHGAQFKVLAPKWWFFQEWKKNHDNAFYLKHFDAEVLGPLDAADIVRRLVELSGGKDMALVCYEKPGDFCHRHHVAEWLTENGFPTSEWVKEVSR